jgi:hypothetical protein
MPRRKEIKRGERNGELVKGMNEECLEEGKQEGVKESCASKRNE